MKDFLVLVAASIPVSGALLVQIYESKAARRQAYEEKRLSSLLEVHLAVEEAVGRWFRWTKESLDNEVSQSTRDRAREEAETATHRAWYSTRTFEMFFGANQKMKELAGNMREEVERCKSAAEVQVENFKKNPTLAFDPAPFSSNKAVNLDEVATLGRRILGFPD